LLDSFLPSSSDVLSSDSVSSLGSELLLDSESLLLLLLLLGSEDELGSLFFLASFRFFFRLRPSLLRLWSPPRFLLCCFSERLVFRCFLFLLPD
jgi:hypothetical protein